MYVILGLGRSGEAVRRFLQREGHSYICVDRRGGEGILSDEESPQVEDITALIKSPGILWTHPWVVAAEAWGVPVLSELDLALPRLEGKRVIGITGSNGKTTTVTALGHVLGIQSVCAGNIGLPLLDCIDHPAPYIVVELSSFQLERLAEGPWFDYGCILNITLNHLDHHHSFEEYCAAKERLGKCLKRGSLLRQKDFASYEENVETIFQERYRSGGEQLYAHDRSNFAAVYALCCALGIPAEQFARQIVTVKKPPHRLEFVCERNGVRVINDSKATSVDATLKAIAALPAPQLVIVGGVDKGGSYRQWGEGFQGKVRQVYAIGEAAEKIEQEIGHCVFLRRCETLAEAVTQALQEARKGETLLLSPGCSSYDQFANYEERGTIFKQLVSSACRRES